MMDDDFISQPCAFAMLEGIEKSRKAAMIILIDRSNHCLDL
jgi:hypothetical protein